MTNAPVEPIAPDMSIAQFLCTDTGVVRSRNEDALLALPELGLWAVCDGMGGHDAGDYASGYIVSRLHELPDLSHPGSRVRAIEQCLLESNRHLIAYTREQGAEYVGSTVVALMLDARSATVIWVGDSRAYRFRAGAVRLMSLDHSVAQEQADRGIAIDDESPNAITRAIGVMDELKTDLISSEVCRGDAWLLCSDGVSGSVEQIAMARIVESGADPARELVELAIQNGSRDNCTAIVLRID